MVPIISVGVKVINIDIYKSYIFLEGKSIRIWNRANPNKGASSGLTHL